MAHCPGPGSALKTQRLFLLGPGDVPGRLVRLSLAEVGFRFVVEYGMERLYLFEQMAEILRTD